MLLQLESVTWKPSMVANSTAAIFAVPCIRSNCERSALT